MADGSAQPIHIYGEEKDITETKVITFADNKIA